MKSTHSKKQKGEGIMEEKKEKKKEKSCGMVGCHMSNFFLFKKKQKLTMMSC